MLPPKLDALGHQPFTGSEQQSLARWLQEPAWPRGTLNAYALEGYLTSLLVCSVGLQPGAWLPPIWNEGGWKLPPPIDTAQRYGEFLELVVGLLRKIDRDLLHTPPTFELSLPSSRTALALQASIEHWAQGFGRGLLQSVQTRVVPSLEARNAVRAIAAYATDHHSVARDGSDRAEMDIAQAVLTLAKARVSRGPLGILPKRQTAVERAD